LIIVKNILSVSPDLILLLSSEIWRTFGGL
jgi:hypothetical protein